MLLEVHNKLIVFSQSDYILEIWNLVGLSGSCRAKLALNDPILRSPFTGEKEEKKLIKHSEPY
jgi:hypothetical protein